jgi:integral membrane protein
MAHGLLFLLFVFAATGVANQERWPGQRLVLAYLASVLPLGPFVLHRRIFPPEAPVS